MTNFDTSLKKIASGVVQYDSAFGGEDSDSDMDLGNDYIHTYTLSFFLSFLSFFGLEDPSQSLD